MKPHRFVAASLSIALASLAPQTAIAVSRAPADAPAAPSFVAVSVASETRNADALSAWATDAARQAIAEAGIERHEVGDRELVVEIAGKQLAYDVTVGVRASGKWVAGPKHTVCNCVGDDFFAHVKNAVAELAPDLRAPVEAVPPDRSQPETPTQPPGNPPGDMPTPRKIGPPGVAGIVVGVVGVAGLATGIGLALRDTPLSRDGDDLQHFEGRDTREAGIVVAALGGAAIVAGIALIVVDRKQRKRRMAVVPAVDKRGVGLLLQGRF